MSPSQSTVLPKFYGSEGQDIFQLLYSPLVSCDRSSVTYLTVAYTSTFRITSISLESCSFSLVSLVTFQHLLAYPTSQNSSYHVETSRLPLPHNSSRDQTDRLLPPHPSNPQNRNSYSTLARHNPNRPRKRSSPRPYSSR